MGKNHEVREPRDLQDAAAKRLVGGALGLDAVIGGGVPLSRDRKDAFALRLDHHYDDLVSALEELRARQGTASLPPCGFDSSAFLGWFTESSVLERLDTINGAVHFFDATITPAPVAPTREEVEALSESLCAGVRDLAIRHPEHPMGIVTISAGAASAIPGLTSSAEDFLHSADEMLYKAKNSGRNCWILSITPRVP